MSTICHSEINALYLFKKALEFRSIHTTLQPTKFTPLQCQLVKFCIFAEFLDTKLWEKPNFEIPEDIPIKAGVPIKICHYQWLITFHALILFIRCNVFMEFRGQKKRYKEFWY